ncbi:MAG: response regulator [Deltaproteobacteria bacterium]|nr:response regulator [Deltaproteobacteria bacterium]MBW2117756.1 response regulator [Deltaproteobacteria bacterium]MBW2344083.1 response regulator [Deltaproteobacteria bacterium]
MKTRVLMVDDEKEFVETLSERLILRDYDVTTAFNGEEAIDKVKNYLFDVIILDVLMPGMSGIETLREIKKIKPLIEVIMLTGNATMETAIEGMKLGALDFLLKPCETEALIAKIDKAYAKKAEQDERIRAARVEELVSSPRAALKE